MLEEHKETIEKKRLVAGILIITFFSLLLVVTPQARGVQFYISTDGWDYPDAYDQGIHTWYAQSNRTGSWVTYEAHNYLESYGAVEWNVSQTIRMVVWCSVNYTLLGLSDTDAHLIAGRNYIQHNVSVVDQFGTNVFTQQNFTFDYNESYSGIFWYRHYVILDFVPIEGEYYTVTLRCQIYW